jgi:hypothetical protein
VEFGLFGTYTPIDVSGAVYIHTASWTTSGSVYYDTITHNLGNWYPVVEL